MSCYSLDLRTKIIKYIEKGNSVNKTSETFGIAVRTIFYWKALHEKNELKPKNNSVRKPKKVNPETLKKYIKNNPEKTIQQIADHFNVCGQAVFYRIKKLNFTYKKKNSYIKKEMKKEEQNTLKKS